ncbi:hypothetical protein [Lacticaseibacillus hulanensis]|uniref:hypothetical protein n=1 Tax=Lacticaseibacillus hulanensis TaxID=2493111 RepID=UPI0013E38815|nr:hypothetical protein [Lacticaseibacillus hulanensis]
MKIICMLVTAISAFVSLGFAIQAYAKARGNQTAALTNAKYALSRSLALVIAACGLLIVRDAGYLIALAVTMTGVQLFDGIIGIKVSWFKTLGPLCTAIANALVLALYLLA